MHGKICLLVVSGLLAASTWAGGLTPTPSGASGGSTAADVEASCPPFTTYSDDTLGAPRDITAGSDGALWFDNRGNSNTKSMGRIATDGTITAFADPRINTMWDVATGPDGAVWFTGSSSADGGAAIGRVATDGTFSFYTSPDFPTTTGLTGIAPGPDGAMWFTDPGHAQIGRITMGGTVTAFPTGAGTDPNEIVAGPDGALWFTNESHGSLGRITTDGTVTTYTDPALAGSYPDWITAGPDDALWFTMGGKSAVGRITTAGAVTTFALDPQKAFRGGGITSGPDGALWVASGSGSIVRITTAGSITYFTLDCGRTYQPVGIASGPDGALWFTTTSAIAIGRLAPPPVNTFRDDDGDVHEGMIEAIYAEHITGGCSATDPGLYCPALPVTRGQMASFLARAFDLPAATRDYFTDDNGTTHEDNINRVAEAGIASGTGASLYSPDAPVTRAQMGSFLARALGLSPSTTNHFTDVSGTHTGNINAIYERGITAGCTADGTMYCPNASVRRDQMASFLGRALGLTPA